MDDDDAVKEQDWAIACPSLCLSISQLPSLWVPDNKAVCVSQLSSTPLNAPGKKGHTIKALRALQKSSLPRSSMKERQDPYPYPGCLNGRFWGVDGERESLKAILQTSA